jgi:mono/diheme cytochrome c family protein
VRLKIILVLALFAVVAAGCGAVKRVTSGNPYVGRQLFIQKCGSCHTLAQAKTIGTIGPNLDYAFGPVKQQGFHISTITDVVRGQISIPDTNPEVAEPACPGGCPGMTPNLLHGQQARDVAVYVGLCAAAPHCDVKNQTYLIDDGKYESS